MDDNDVQQLISACQHGDLKCFEAILDNGVQCDCELDSSGNTPLHIAAANGQVNVVVELLKRGAVVARVNHAGWTALLHAAFHGHSAVVDVLLCNRANINEANKLGLNPLVAAICGGHSATVHLLLEAGALLDCTELSNFTPLMAAALYCHEDIVCLLLDKGASINQSAYSTKVTVLMMAACGGSKTIVQRLVECGADTNSISLGGHTALDVAVACGKWEVKAYLTDKTNSTYHTSANRSEEEEMIEHIRQGNNNVVKTLVEREPHLVNWCNSDGATPLMEAAIAGNVELVKFFFQNGSVLDQQDTKNGWTALMQAVYHEHTEVIHYLLAVGASLYMMAFDGYTALDLAWLLEKPDIAHFLLQWKVDETVAFNSGTQRLLTSYKQSTVKNASLRLKQSSNMKIKNLLGNLTTRIQIFKSSRPITPATPVQTDANENRFFPESVKSKGSSPMTMLKLSSFHLHKKKVCKDSMLWDVPINPPLIPSLEMSKAMAAHLPPKCQTPKQSLYPVHLLRTYHGVGKSTVSHSTAAAIKNRSRNALPLRKTGEERTSKSSETAVGMCGKDKSVGKHRNVEGLLQGLSLDRYVQKMKHHEIDLETFKILTEENLDEIGVSYGPRQQLLSAIQSLRKAKDSTN